MHVQRDIATPSAASSTASDSTAHGCIARCSGNSSSGYAHAHHAGSGGMVDGMVALRAVMAARACEVCGARFARGPWDEAGACAPTCHPLTAKASSHNTLQLQMG